LVSSKSVLVDRINTAWPSKKNLEWWNNDEIAAIKSSSTLAPTPNNETSVTINEQTAAVTLSENESENSDDAPDELQALQESAHRVTQTMSSKKKQNFWKFVRETLQCLSYTFHSAEQAIEHCSKDFNLIQCLLELLRQEDPKQLEICSDASNLLEYIFSYCGQKGIYFDLSKAGITNIVANLALDRMPCLCRVLACCLGDWELYPLETDKALEADTKLPYPSLLQSTDHILTSKSYKQNKQNELCIVESDQFIENLCKLIFRQADIHKFTENEVSTNMWMLYEMIGIENHIIKYCVTVLQLLGRDASPEYANSIAAQQFANFPTIINAMKKVANVQEMSVKIEASFVLTLLLAGKSRKRLSKTLVKLKFVGENLRSLIVDKVFKETETKENHIEGETELTDDYTGWFCKKVT
jgi:hypothetical protein